MTKIDKIKKYYFKNKMTINDIAQKMEVSKQYVSKIIRNDSRFVEEKNIRIKNQVIKRKKQKMDCKNKKRKEIYDYNAILNYQHTQAAVELSGRKTINNRAFRDWNSSIYEFHIKAKQYRVKKDLTDKISYAVPKKIDWK